jgi:hypothetical protein
VEPLLVPTGDIDVTRKQQVILMRRILTSLAVTAALASALGSSATAAAAAPDWTPLAPAAEPTANPLKGFIPFAGDFDNFPHSMEWAYFPVNAVMTGPNTFDWATMDSALDEIGGRGHQTALRFYLDYPTRQTGIPKFLLDGGLETRPYNDFNNNGVSVSPDYNDPQLLAAIDDFVAALGERYDGDARIGYVQAGLIGFWGEWHTWPYNGEGKPNWMPTDANQLRVLNDFTSAFTTTELEVRNPNTMNAPMAIGYHDDSFALETKTSSLGWHFMDNMVAAGTTEKWKDYSIGGELRPELQPCIFSASGCPVLEEGGDNDFPGSVAQTHVSWMMNDYAFRTGYSDADKPAALLASQSLGYSFRATEALLSEQPGGGSATVGLRVSNVGVAPFYYDWPVTVAYLDSNGDVAATFPTDWHVADIAADSAKEFTTTIDTSDLAAGAYTVSAREHRIGRASDGSRHRRDAARLGSAPSSPIEDAGLAAAGGHLRSPPARSEPSCWRCPFRAQEMWLASVDGQYSSAERCEHGRFSCGADTSRRGLHGPSATSLLVYSRSCRCRLGCLGHRLAQRHRWDRAAGHAGVRRVGPRPGGRRLAQSTGAGCREIVRHLCAALF